MSYLHDNNSLSITFHDLFYDSIGAPLPQNKIRKPQKLKYFRRYEPFEEYKSLHKENPIGPTYLYTSSCLQPFQDKFVYCDHTNKAKIFVPETGNQIKIDQEVKDTHLGKYSRIYGLKTNEDIIGQISH